MVENINVRLNNLLSYIEKINSKTITIKQTNSSSIKLITTVLQEYNEILKELTNTERLSPICSYIKTQINKMIELDDNLIEYLNSDEISKNAFSLLHRECLTGHLATPSHQKKVEDQKQIINLLFFYDYSLYKNNTNCLNDKVLESLKRSIYECKKYYGNIVFTNNISHNKNYPYSIVIILEKMYRKLERACTEKDKNLKKQK